MKNKSLSLFDIACREEEFVKDAVTESFDILLSVIEDLDYNLPLLEQVEEYDDSSFIPLYSVYSSVESSFVYLDALLDDVLDSANRIHPLSKIEGTEKKEKKMIRELSDSIISAVDDFVVACDEVLDYFAERTPEQIRSSSLSSHMLETLSAVLAKCEEIADSYYDTALWADPSFEEYLTEEEGDDEGDEGSEE